MSCFMHSRGRPEELWRGVTDEFPSAAEQLGPIDAPGVGVGHVQLSGHRVGGQVVAVGRVVTEGRGDSSLRGEVQL